MTCLAALPALSPAPLAALPAPPSPLAALLAASAVSLRPPLTSPPEPKFTAAIFVPPVIPAITFASVEMTLTTATTTGMIALSIGRKMFPIDCAAVCSWLLRILIWLAGLDAVRARSFCAQLTCDMMALYRSIAFSACVIEETFLLMPRLYASCCRRAFVRSYPSARSGSISPARPDLTFSKASSFEMLKNDARS